MSKRRGRSISPSPRGGTTLVARNRSSSPPSLGSCRSGSPFGERIGKDFLCQEEAIATLRLAPPNGGCVAPPAKYRPVEHGQFPLEGTDFRAAGANRWWPGRGHGMRFQ